MSLLLFSTMNNQKEHSDLVEIELKNRLASISKTDTLYVDFTLNDFLINFLEENMYTKEKNFSEYNTLVPFLSESNIKMIFNEQEVIYLKKEINNNFTFTEKDIILKRVVRSNYEEEKKAIGNDGMKLINFKQKERLFMSKPVILSNQEYAISAYSYGNHDSFSSGIHIYRKIKGVWKIYAEIKTSFS
ncbi:hypothetical protein IMCC3317_20970 [Kordia antarctica]|uniref:Uncharacterized protein n=2 Tax=Kordia antarctica TaxID=1218801 RepID=A0A7L4ZJT0_9FLAO|nr:hypothetical protein IMCC3317_20970 [Kordia antarctica]